MDLDQDSDHKKRKNISKIFGIVLIFVIAIIIGVFILMESKEESSEQTKTYRNEEYGYSFSYPSSWEIDDEKSLGGPGFRPAHLSFMGIQEEKYDKEKDCFFTAIVTTSPKGDNMTCKDQSEVILGSNTFTTCFNDDIYSIPLSFFRPSEKGKYLTFSYLTNSSCQNILENSLKTLSIE